MTEEQKIQMKQLLTKVDEAVIEYNDFMNSLNLKGYKYVVNYEPIFWAKKFIEDWIPMFTQEELKGVSRSTLSEEYKPLVNHNEKINLTIQ